MTTDTLAAFEFSDLGVDHTQYFQGAGVAFTDWDDVFVGIGDCAREAAEDALEMLAQSTDLQPTPEMYDATNQFDESADAHAGCTEHACDAEKLCSAEQSEHEADCPVVTFEACSCHDECELHHYVALYVRYT